MTHENGQRSDLQRHRINEKPLDPDNDPIKHYLSYYNDSPTANSCKICRRKSTMAHSEPSPTFMLSFCQDWFHKACLTHWLRRDSAAPMDDCLKCQELHYRVRFKGPLILDLNDYFATSDLPEIRARPSHTSISMRVQNVEDEAKRPIFGDVMDFCEEPEQVQDGLGIIKPSTSGSAEVTKARDKQANLLQRVLKHRRVAVDGKEARLKDEVLKGRNTLKER